MGGKDFATEGEVVSIKSSKGEPRRYERNSDRRGGGRRLKKWGGVFQSEGGGKSDADIERGVEPKG